MKIGEYILYYVSKERVMTVGRAGRVEEVPQYVISPTPVPVQEDCTKLLKPGNGTRLCGIYYSRGTVRL